MKKLLILFCACLITGCATHSNPTTKGLSPAGMSELAQGQRYFEAGYYKSAMQKLLPIATDGNATAQYAVGYMYYYGQGVAQDTNIGYFWIKRSADQHYQPAVDALKTIARDS